MSENPCSCGKDTEKPGCCGSESSNPKENSCCEDKKEPEKTEKSGNCGCGCPCK